MLFTSITVIFFKTGFVLYRGAEVHPNLYISAPVLAISIILSRVHKKMYVRLQN